MASGRAVRAPRLRAPGHRWEHPAFGYGLDRDLLVVRARRRSALPASARRRGDVRGEVLKDLERSRSVEARVILGAAVIDDVLGLIILAVVTAAATMQVAGGIGYTNVFPVERIVRDLRLASIWTGTNEIMNLIIQHEFYKEFLEKSPTHRDVEADAEGAELDGEKVYE